ncbi:AAA family ATPase [Gordonia sp. PP30]|uniref:RNA polymerase recycling motor ATPase HelR n=1 Tax=Gordonia sp. PP30 TaxID=2935861 RepID=UPI001FFED332|nr:RNA polymerase recycling motor ATPase HelR [Gordonia sp. PP30]UQE76543.1 AAA family ATPase [Gordonia sp. PP30]
MPAGSSHFRLPASLARKTVASLIDGDDAHFAAVDAAVSAQAGAVSDRLDTLRAIPARAGREAVERDAEIRTLTARLALLRRRGADLCLGRMTGADGSLVYLGRLGVTGRDGRELLLDWRTPAAAPFFAASRATPSGLVARRRYRWSGGRVVDYWDEALTDEGLVHGGALDAESSFLASLADARTTRMRDVLATLAADQHAIIRDDSPGTLVVDGGPGTGKTVVALHRAAYLLYADPRVGAARGGVLFVGPTDRYLAYVADVLPDLGEEGTRFATIGDLVPEGRSAGPDTDREVAAAKSRLTGAIERAVAFYEEPPAEPVVVESGGTNVEVTPADWALAFDGVEPGTPHNEARPAILDALVEVLSARHDTLPLTGLRAEIARAWPLLDARDVIADLWTVPAYLRYCAPALSDREVRLLRRADGYAWTRADLPLLDAARHRLGDADALARERRRDAETAEQRRVMADVLDELVAADDDREGLVQQFSFGGMAALTTDYSGLPDAEPDRLAGPFAHVVVDEAQELTDAEWAMLRRRCRASGFTVVGDRAQARGGFAESWEERLRRCGLRNIRVARLGLNYRTPREVMDVAAREIIRVLPDANVPDSVRGTGRPVRECSLAEVPVVLDEWLAEHDGVSCVIATPEVLASIPERPRVVALDPAGTSGLEFDLVIVCAPASFGDGLPGAVSRYIAMTRATGELVIAS